MHTRSLSTGESFDVLTLPKGTVLFHGFYAIFDETISEDKLFTELFGNPDESGDFCVAPNTQKFFYPAPFMGDTVYNFQLYGIFVLNYDVHLVSMVLPSTKVHREEGHIESATIKCKGLDDMDECGMKYKGVDHCLTPLMLKEHPDIHGYIAIPGNDGWFKTKFHVQLRESYPEYVEMTTPMIVTNATGLSAIPEIVLHPFHVRSVGSYITPSRAVHDPIKYILSNAALLNYMPLIYFSEKNTFSLLDLEDSKTRILFLKTLRNNTGKAITSLHTRIKTFIDNALSPDGVFIHNMLFKMTIDLKTGFYFAKYIRVDSQKNIKNIKIFTPDNNAYDIIPFEYPEYMKKRLHGLLASSSKLPIDERTLSNVLAKHKASYNKVYIFDKGRSKVKFEMEKAFPFPKKLHLRNKTRKHKDIKTHFHTKTLKNRSTIL